MIAFANEVKHSLHEIIVGDQFVRSCGGCRLCHFGERLLHRKSCLRCRISKRARVARVSCGLELWISRSKCFEEKLVDGLKSRQCTMNVELAIAEGLLCPMMRTGAESVLLVSLQTDTTPGTGAGALQNRLLCSCLAVQAAGEAS